MDAPSIETVDGEIFTTERARRLSKRSGLRGGGRERVTHGSCDSCSWEGAKTAQTSLHRYMAAADNAIPLLTPLQQYGPSPRGPTETLHALLASPCMLAHYRYVPLPSPITGRSVLCSTIYTSDLSPSSPTHALHHGAHCAVPPPLRAFLLSYRYTPLRCPPPSPPHTPPLTLQCSTGALPSCPCSGLSTCGSSGTSSARHMQQRICTSRSVRSV